MSALRNLFDQRETHCDWKTLGRREGSKTREESIDETEEGETEEGACCGCLWWRARRAGQVDSAVQPQEVGLASSAVSAVSLLSSYHSPPAPWPSAQVCL